ncbi:MAG: GIY-YIG nuclease family protein [Bacteroidetes bacterium]|nr:MAG: GIY-YIG nuclease family protein [Bacteroidota bacterium]
MEKYYVYVVESLKDTTRYIGFTSDIEKRIKEHNHGKTKSIKHKTPFQLVYKEEFENKTEARKREIRLKKNSWERKQVYEKIDSNK